MPSVMKSDAQNLKCQLNGDEKGRDSLWLEMVRKFRTSRFVGLQAMSVRLLGGSQHTFRRRYTARYFQV